LKSNKRVDPGFLAGLFPPRSSLEPLMECEKLDYLSPSVAPDICKASVRNNPFRGWVPSFVVWPLTTEHVQVTYRMVMMQDLGPQIAF